MRYSTCSTATIRSERSARGGMANSAPLALIRCLARLMRWATVASGTRNARAISAVVSPPTARSVKATWEGGVSDGWQHSSSGVRVPPAGGLVAPQLGPPAGGHGDQPARRVGGHALGRPLRRRAQQRLLHGVLAGVEAAVAPDQHAQDPWRQLAQQLLDPGGGAHNAHNSSQGRTSMTGRTSTSL